MNLREVHLSSRSVIPAALALPINREPDDVRSQTEWIQRQREASNDQTGPEAGTVSFYL